MILGIDPAITPELLFALARMGHGDEIVVADLNFPAYRLAGGCVVPQPLRLALPMPQAVESLLRLIPADTHDGPALHTMKVVGGLGRTPPAVAELAQIAAPRGIEMAGLERHDFYARAGRAFAIVIAAEPRAYGNAILRKGVQGQDPAPMGR